MVGMAVETVLAQVTAVGSIRQILRERLKTERQVPPLTEASWLRASALADLCPREEVLAARLKLERTDSVDPDGNLTYAHGHGLHWALQNRVLSEVGILLGQWRCLQCATLYGGHDPTGKRPLSEQYVRRPEKCSKCGNFDSEEFVYVEQYYKNEEYRIGAHPDGFLAIAGFPGIGVFEGKSMGGRTAVEVRVMPMLSHVVQVHVYLWLTGFRWAKILYWEKGGSGLNALVEHTVERDEQTIENIKSLIASIWRGIRTGDLPERICESKDDRLARECPAREPCFRCSNVLSTDPDPWGFE